jgi:hypothetical protein
MPSIRHAGSSDLQRSFRRYGYQPGRPGVTFKTYFPQADMKVFEIIDADQDNSLSHEEWHRFKEAHGLKHQ